MIQKFIRDSITGKHPFMKLKARKKKPGTAASDNILSRQNPDLH